MWRKAFIVRLCCRGAGTVLLLAALAVLVVAGVGVAAFLMSSSADVGTTRSSEASEEAKTKPTGAKPAAPTAPTEETTTLSPHPAVEPKPLMCLVDTYATKDTVYPPDGLCDLLSCFVEVREPVSGADYAITYPAQDQEALKNFYKAAEASSATQFGIHFKASPSAILRASVAGMNDPKGKAALRAVWDKKVQHFSLLGFSPVVDSPGDAISLLNKLKEHRDAFKAQGPEVDARIYLGLFMPDTVVSSAKQMAAIEDLVRKADPDEILYLKVTLTAGPSCTITAANIYKEGPAFFQTTIEGALKAREADPVLQSKPSILTLSVAPVAFEAEKGHTFGPGDKLGAACGKTLLVERPWVCANLGSNVATKDDTYDVFYLVRKDKNQLAVFDDKETYKKKMCAAVTEGKFDGGWAVEYVELADAKNLCGDGEFAVLGWVKDNMKGSCP